MINVDAAFSRGDVMRRIADLEAKLSAMSTARRLEAAAIGKGGLRIRGGRLTIQDIDGDDMLRAGGDPGEFFLRQDLLTPLALAVLSDRQHTAPTVTTALPESTTSTSFTDLTTAGPSVSGVDVVTGRALVLLGGALVANPGEAPVMGFEISGATSREADDFGGVLALFAGAAGDAVALTTTAVVPVDGLNEGTHTFTAKYKSDQGGTALFNQRALTVIAY